MSTVWNWQPFFDQVSNAANTIGQRNLYNNAVQGLFQGPNIQPQTVTPQMGAGDSVAARQAAGDYTPPGQGPLNSMAGMAPFFQSLGPQVGLPLLAQTAGSVMQNQAKAAALQPSLAAYQNAKTPQEKQAALIQYTAAGGDAAGLGAAMKDTLPIIHEGSPNGLFQTDPATGVTTQVSAPIPKAPTTRTIQRGSNNVEQQFNPTTGQFEDIPGATGPKFNPNSDSAGWAVAFDPANGNTPFRYNSRTGAATDLQGNPYVPGGFSKPAVNNPRTAVAIYMDKWKQEHPNATAAETATAMNEFNGQQAENHTLGTIGAKVESSNAGLDTVINQAQAAYSKLPRGSFVPFNQLAKMAQTNAWSTPEQADAFAADTAAINMWAKSINPTGVLTVENARRGQEMLSQAQSPEAHTAVLERMRKEGQAAQAGVNAYRGNAPKPPTPSASNTSGWSNFRQH